ncbi:amidoligase family protein [Ectothiorhodospira lacustris]|uniref:amidoligase family protein n=1 Tax=Ectothiorhodospira lacustris TaxID=2899127 RepID=UPI001EE9A0DF|nr:amidoligase family protein [Ectothiorhodospira lacustris]MCG5499322.1 amidoligase family protein [Ectothiorhodospira lacustris]MCG5509211.1 amidoligase family protein [Ectothiorhodospira lacustris]MCG5521001.1 amidoligase family protein [Ectothiorhodospira lacustris]
MTAFAPLPHRQTPDGSLRRVGVELEMADISLDAIAAIIIDCFGGKQHRHSPFEHEITGTRLGDFQLELDSSLLKRREYLDYLENMGVSVDRDAEPGTLEHTLAGVAGLIVPHEVVAPPIPHDTLPELDHLRARLQAAGAKGTHASLVYAFGLQLNLELARHDADYILRHLQAFLLLNDWLLEEAQTDLSRRLTPFVEPFPAKWGQRILRPDYAPDLEQLIDDYLTDNPTRNRPLDMLPLFAHLSPGRIEAAPVEHHLIRPRPTFHYRLPDCRIDEPDWNLSMPWNGWVAVERLAADPQRLMAVARAYLDRPDETLADKGRRWATQVSDWLRR